jgi:hypothetical protein
MSPHQTEGAHVDLRGVLLTRGAVSRGRHLRFACPAHDDAHPSADYEPALRVWVCRSCGTGGGARDLARRLGLIPVDPPPPPRRRDAIPPPPPRVLREAWEPAWNAIVDEARRQDQRAAPYRALGRAADWLRSQHQAVADARRIASAIGDDPRAWRLLGLAARVATTAASIESALDDAAREIDR